MTDASDVAMVKPARAESATTGPAPPVERDETHERIIFGGLLVFTLFSSRIAMAQASIFLALLVWVLQLRARPRPLRIPRAAVPLGIFGALTLLSCLFSDAPLRSMPHIREVFVYLVVVLVANHVTSRFKMEALMHGMFTSAAVLSVWGVVQYFAWSGGTEHRIRGPISHWMTFAGILVIAVCFSLAYAVYHPRIARRPLYALLSILITTALVLTLTRGAWVALLVAVLVLALLRNRVLLLAIPVVLAGAYMLSPVGVKERVATLASGEDETTVDRLYLWRSGLQMIEDHPVFGVGLSMVGLEYTAKYRDPRAPKARGFHLHNNVLQVAAERGVPALAAWLWFFGAVLARVIADIRSSSGRPRPTIVGTLLALCAFQAFGLFEHNFGDSELLMLIMFVIGLPYAEEHLPAAEA